MSRTFSTSLALRLAGIFALFQSIYPITFLIGRLVSGPGPADSMELEWILSGALWLAAALVLLLSAPALATRFAGTDGDERPTTGADPRRVQLVGFRLLGAYGILQFGPALARECASIAADVEIGAFVLSRSTGAIASVVGVAIGVSLLLGARGLSEFVDRIRGIGLEEAERPWGRT